jgi:hypothetical protein
VVTWGDDVCMVWPFSVSISDYVRKDLGSGGQCRFEAGGAHNYDSLNDIVLVRVHPSRLIRLCLKIHRTRQPSSHPDTFSVNILLKLMRCPLTINRFSQIGNMPELVIGRGENAVELLILLEARHHLLHLRISIIRVLHPVPNRPLVAEKLPVVAARVRLVAEEVDLVVDESPRLLRLNVSQAVGLVPAGGEDVEGDLAADGICEAGVGEGFLELGDHGLPDLVLEVVLLVFVALVGGGVTADRGHVDHAVAELDEGTALNGDVEVGDVV